MSAVGESLCAFASALGPIIGAPLFAWSEGNGMSSQLQLSVAHTLYRNGVNYTCIIVELKGDSSLHIIKSTYNHY